MNTVRSQVQKLANRIDPRSKQGGLLGIATITGATATETLLTGTAWSVSGGTPTKVTGTGTKFLTETAVGDHILLDSTEKVVDAINGDTELIVTVAFSGAASGTTIRNGYPVTVTAPNHGFQTGDVVLIADVLGMTELNGTNTITVLTSNTFTVPVKTTQTYSSGGTAMTLCITEGDKLSPQRLLDIYNDARVALFSALRAKGTLDDLVKAISGAIVELPITFTASGGRYVYTLPAGYLKAIGLEGFSESSAMFMPIVILPATVISRIRSGDKHFAQSDDFRSVVEEGTQLIHYGSFLGLQNISGTAWQAQKLNQISATGAAFTKQLAAGTMIWLDSNVNTVDSVIDDNNITVVTPFAAPATGTTMRRKLTGGAWSVTADTSEGANRTVVGTGTKFTSELVSGAYILLDSIATVVDEIFSDTLMTVLDPFLTSTSGTTIERVLGRSTVSWSVAAPLDLVVGTGTNFTFSLRTMLNVVNGTGTLFTFSLRRGNHILLDTTPAIVRQVTDDSQIVIATPLAAAASGATIKKVITGTSSASLGDTTVHGSGTIFTSELKVGESVLFNGVAYSIASIESDTLLHTYTFFDGDYDGMAMSTVLGSGWSVSWGANNFLLDATPVTVKEVYDDTHVSITTPLGAAASGATITKVITGTSSASLGDTTVHGSGTIFTSELKVGESVLFNGVAYSIASISSDTLLHTHTFFDGDYDGMAMSAVLGTGWAVSDALNVVNGSGTAFTQQITAACHVFFGATQKIISSVLSDTRLIVTTVFGAPTSGTVINRILTGSAWAVSLSTSYVNCADGKFKSEVYPGLSIELYHEDGSHVTKIVDSVIDDTKLKVTVVFSATDGGVGIREFLIVTTWQTVGSLYTLIGTGTKFLKELSVGLTMRLFHADGSYIERVIDEIYSDTLLKATVAFDTIDNGPSIKAANYTLRYIGIANFTIADVTGGTTLETFNLDFEPKILDMAEKIALEQGAVELTKIAEAMV